MKTMNKLLGMLLSFAILLLLAQCSSDDGADPVDDDPMDDDDTEVIDISDGNAVTEAITIAGATVVTGSPPAPSTDPDAPAIDDQDDVFAVQGGELQFNLDVSSGDVAGVYLQIAGADSYFDIPASAFGGRAARQDDPSFTIELPDNIEPGEFCSEVCVYDSENRVSNIVEICVTVEELGGADSDFLVGLWNVTQLEHIYDGMTEIEVIGEVQIDTYTETLVCADGQTEEEVTIEETEVIEYIRLNFSSNGALRFEQYIEDTYLDWGQSTCENLVYETDIDDIDTDGAWSYQSASETLILLINEIDDDGTTDVDAIELTLEVSGDGETITATQDFGDGEITIVTLVKGG